MPTCQDLITSQYHLNVKAGGLCVASLCKVDLRVFIKKSAQCTVLSMEFQYYANYERPIRRVHHDQPWWDEEDNLSDRRINGKPSHAVSSHTPVNFNATESRILAAFYD